MRMPDSRNICGPTDPLRLGRYSRVWTFSRSFAAPEFGQFPAASPPVFAVSLSFTDGGRRRASPLRGEEQRFFHSFYATMGLTDRENAWGRRILQTYQSYGLAREW